MRHPAVKYRFSKGQEGKIVELYQRGFSAKYLAKYFLCAPATIGSILARWGMRTKGYRHLTFAEELEIAKLYRRGFLQRELADKFRRSIGSIRYALKHQNVTIRYAKPKYTPTLEQIKKATLRIQEGWSEGTRQERANESKRPFTVPQIENLSHTRYNAIGIT